MIPHIEAANVIFAVVPSVIALLAVFTLITDRVK